MVSFSSLGPFGPSLFMHRVAPRSESAQISTGDHPRHAEMDTSHINKVKAPQHRETRYITHRLSIEPQNIEELTELRDYKS